MNGSWHDRLWIEQLRLTSRQRGRSFFQLKSDRSWEKGDRYNFRLISLVERMSLAHSNCIAQTRSSDLVHQFASTRTKRTWTIHRLEWLRWIIRSSRISCQSNWCRAGDSLNHDWSRCNLPTSRSIILVIVSRNKEAHRARRTIIILALLLNVFDESAT